MTLRRAHGKNAVNVRDDGVGDVLVKAGHLHVRDWSEFPGAIGPILAFAKEEKQDDERDQRIDRKSGQVAENGRAEAHHAQADFLRVRTNDGVEIVFGKIDPVPNVVQWSLHNVGDERSETAFLGTSPAQVMRGIQSFVSSNGCDDEGGNSKDEENS